MGTETSKEPQPATNQETTNRQANNNNIYDESGGFHLIELHLPTVNFGAGMLVFFVVVAGLAYFACKYRRQRRLQALRNRLATDPFGGGFRRPGFPGGGLGGDIEAFLGQLAHQQQQQQREQEALPFRNLGALDREIARGEVIAGREPSRSSGSYFDQSSTINTSRKNNTVP